MNLPNEAQIRPPWLSLALTKLGTKELPGTKANSPDILEFHSTTTLKATTDEVSWCSSFVNWSIVKSGFVGTNSARARDWCNWGLDVKKLPPYGSIVVMSRGSNPLQGHVGFYLYHTPDRKKIVVLSGNFGNKVCIDEFLANTVLAYRWVR